MNYNVPPEFQINLTKKSTTKTLNNYLKKEVINTLEDCLNKGLIIDTNYWAAELFSSGFYLPLWDCLFRFYFRSIHYHNPHMIDYINQKYALLCQIKKMYSGNLNNLCNNQELRNHLAEVVTSMCLSKKDLLSIPSSVNENVLDEVFYEKISKIISIIAPTLSNQSILHKQFVLLISTYYNDFDSCLYYLDWFVRDNDHIIGAFDEFNVPASLTHKSMWLVWKFILLQFRNTKVSDHELLLETLINLYIAVYRRKDYETCTYILMLVLTLVRHPQKLEWSQALNLGDPKMIKQCVEINMVYQNLQSSHNVISKTTATKKDNIKKGRKSKKEIQKAKFYDDKRNNDFLKVINDPNILITQKPSQLTNISSNFVRKKNNSDDDLVVIYNPHNQQ